MSNSSLVDVTILSPNRTSPRNNVIDTITIHHMAGNCTVETCGNIFAESSRQCSSNYGIGSDGRIGLYCHEANRSWCTSSSSNDNRAITIEVANDSGDPDWHISDAAMASLIKLCADICTRNNIEKLLWEDDQSLIGNTSRQNLTLHRWFSATLCPGPYIYSKLTYITEEVNKLIANSSSNNVSSTTTYVPSTVVTTTASTTVMSTSSNEKTIWDMLISNGITKAGAAGIMGNLYAESGLIPNNLQNTYESKLGYTDSAYTEAVDNGSYNNFVNDSAGYGLAQWTYYSRKQGLYDMAISTSRSIGDVTLQLDYLLAELKSTFPSVLSVLMETCSVKDASDLFLLEFERPADQSDTIKDKRASYSQGYYDKYYTSEQTTVDGITSILNNTTSTNSKIVQSLTTAQVAALQTKRESKTIIDLKTGLIFNASWGACATYHSDFTPMTSADTDVIKEILKREGSSCNWTDVNAWSWTARPGILVLNDSTYIACGFHLRPHAAIMGGSPGEPLSNQSNTRPATGWALGGHMCMYYGDSPGTTPGCNEAAVEAYTLGNAYVNSDDIILDPLTSVVETYSNYTVRITATALNYREGPGTDNKINGTIRDKGIYTIVAESMGQGASKWGKLRSGAGWISLDYVSKL